MPSREHGSPGPPLDATDEAASLFVSSNLTIDVRKGHVELMGHRIMLFRFEFLVALQKQLETTMGVSAKGVMYLAGERAAQEVLPAMSERLKELPSGRESLIALRRMSDVWATIGAGRGTVTEFEPDEGRFAFRIDDGSFPDAYGPSPRPVCHLWAGWAAGVAARLFGRDVLCDEVRCRAAGSEACEFVLQPQRVR